MDNNLEDVIKENFDLKTSPDTGLIQNKFEEAEKFANLIQGMGEPVYWVPYLVYEYDVFKNGDEA